MTATKLVLVLLLLGAVGGISTAAGLFWYKSSGVERATDQPLPQAARATNPRPVPAREDFGPEVKGLRAKVALAKGKFEVGEAVLVSYVVKNVSKEEQTLWHSGFWPNHLIVVKDADGKEPPLTEQGKERRRAFSPGGERSKNVPVKVPAGGEDAAYEKYDLTKLYDLSRPGRYTVQYVYEEKQGGWEGRLPSNEAAFEIVAARKQKDVNMAESEPVRSEGLSFVALVPKRVLGLGEVDLGLRVTNVSDKPVALSVNDVISIRLVSLAGEQMGMNCGRNGLPRPKPPVILQPGDSWRWQSEARLVLAGGDRSTMQLRGPDGRGVAGSWWFDTMKQGKYRLSIEYANSNARQGDVALWVGKATTKEVEFEIGPRTNREPGEKPAAKPAQEAVKRDLEKLQGTWRLVAAEEAGQAVPVANFGRNTHWVFSATTGTFTSGKRVLTGTITLDPAKSPRWIDLSHGTDLLLHGIYELKGDRLRLFFVPAGARRPTEFKTEKGTQQSISTYERARTDPE